MLVFDPALIDDFWRMWGSECFTQQRLGQAFYNHFELHKVRDQTQFHNLYELDGILARNLIANIVQHHPEKRS